MKERKEMKKVQGKVAIWLMFVGAMLLVLPGVAMAQRGEGPRQGRGEMHGPMHGEGHGEGMRGMGGLHPRMLMRHAEELGLNEAQQSRIREILEKERGELEPLREEMRAEAQAMRALMQSATAERAQIQEQFENVLEMEMEMKRRRMEVMLGIREVLTPEQREQVMEFRAEHREERQERRQERRGRRQQ